MQLNKTVNLLRGSHKRAWGKTTWKHQYHLICYPYIARDAYGDHNAFPHIDINLEKLLMENQGESQLTSIVSLDDEGADGCTLVVPKFH